MDKNKLKKRCLAQIDSEKEAIIAIGKAIYKTPELGYKEIQSTKLAKAFMETFGTPIQSNIAVTGCLTTVNEGKKGPRIAVMGELDSVVCPEHIDACKLGNVHACGHNIQISNLMGCAVGIIKSGVHEYLDGVIDFIAMPSEECIDLEFRKNLQKNGEIKFFGGKQEFLYRGGFEHIDLLIQSHAMDFQGEKNCMIHTECNGFISKMITFVGKSAHAGIAPHDGVNALNMAHLALGNIHAQRETFKEIDRIRVSAIIRDGGGIVNVVPSKVTMEALVRGANLQAILDANKKTNRSLQAAALALGGEVIIEDDIGYLPLETDRNLDKVVRSAVVEMMGGSDQSIIEEYITAGSTDLGDISHVKPCTHIWMGGIQGGLHTKGYHMEDEYAAYVLPAKVLALSVIDLLYDGASVAKDVIANYKPKLTKETYLNLMQSHSITHQFDYSKE